MGKKNRFIIKFKPYILVTFLVLYYFFTRESLVLRPYSNLIWSFCAVLGIIRMYRKRIFKRLPDYVFMMMLFFLILIINLVMSNDTDSSTDYFIQLTLYFFAGATLFIDETKDFFEKTIWFFSVIFIAFMFIEWMLPSIYNSYIDPLLNSDYSVTREHLRTVDGAVLGFTNQGSVTMMYLNIAAAVCLSRLFRKSGKKKSAVINYLFLIVILICLLLTNRRGGIAVAVLLVAFFMFANNRTRYTTIALAAAAIFLVICLGTDFIPGLSGIMDKVSRQSGDVLHGRTEIWNLILSRGNVHLFVGNGLGTVQNILSVRSSHNSYLQLIYELGIFGTVIFLLPSVSTVIKGLKLFYSMKDKKNKYTELSYVVTALYIQLYVLIQSLTESTLTNTQSWAIIAAMQVQIQFAWINNNAVRINKKTSSPTPKIRKSI